MSSKLIYEFVGGPADGQSYAVYPEDVDTGICVVETQPSVNMNPLAKADDEIQIPQIRRHVYRLRGNKAYYVNCLVSEERSEQ